MTPEEALAAARAAAEEARRRGGYAEDLPGDLGGPFGDVTLEQLLTWSIIEPDLANVRSTRRLGAPITWAKRMLARAMRQYNAELIARQQRFNIQLALYVARLEQQRDDD